jgi:hypothetical protein
MSLTVTVVKNGHAYPRTTQAGSIPAERLSGEEKRLLEDLLSGAFRMRDNSCPARFGYGSYIYTLTIADGSASRTLHLNQLRMPPAFRKLFDKAVF